MFTNRVHTTACTSQSAPLSASRSISILRHPLLLILFISLPFFMLGVGTLALNDNDVMYPQSASGILRTGDWISPRLNGAPDFEKPPLVYWLNVFSQSVLGEIEAVAHIWPVLATWLTILVIGGIGASLYGKRAGWLSALALSGCIGPYLFSRVVAVSTDIPLCLWTALAILSYSKAIIEKGSRHNELWLMVMFACFGLAGPTKSLYGLGLLIAIIGFHAILTGGWRSFPPRGTVMEIVLTAAVVAP